MTRSLSPILSEFTLRRAVAGLVFLPLLAYVFQPFPDVDLSFPQRLVFWVGVTVLALLATWAARKLTRRFFADTRLSSREFALVLVVLMLFVPSLWLMSCLLFSLGGQQVPGVMAVAPYGVLFATGLMLVRGRKESEPPAIDATPERPRLTKRLPRTFNGQIYRLTVRDHFVDVVTSEGVFTIRSRLTDAIAEMEPVPGHCTHRSHWVADGAIASVEKKGGKTFLRLRNDELVPVSRKYKPLLEQDGVI